MITSGSEKILLDLNRATTHRQKDKKVSERRKGMRKRRYIHSKSSNLADVRRQISDKISFQYAFTWLDRVRKKFGVKARKFFEMYVCMHENSLRFYLKWYYDIKNWKNWSCIIIFQTNILFIKYSKAMSIQSKLWILREKSYAEGMKGMVQLF